MNQAAVDEARELIEAGKVDVSTEWSKAAPSTEQQDELMEEDGCEAFGQWHLAVDTTASEQTKGRFRFPYGDFTAVNRAALIHAEQRASQNDHDQIAKAADDLLQRLDRAQS